MEHSRWLTVLLIGLVLAGLVVGYFLFRNTFFQMIKPQVKVNQAVQPSPSISPAANSVLGQNTESRTPSPSPTPSSAYSQIASRTLGATSSLPNTGFPLALIGIFSASAIIIGWGLRKYPH